MMKTLLLLALAATSQDSLAERKAKKLESAFLKKAPWITDYAAAMAKSKESKRPIFSYFTRSYAP